MATWNPPSSISGKTRKERYRLVQGDPERPVLPPEALFLGTEQFYARANAHAQLAIARRRSTTSADNAQFAQARPTCPSCAAPKTRWRACKTHIRNTQHRVLVLAESDGRRESLLDFLRASSVNPPAFDSLLEFQTSDEKLGIATAGLTVGFAWLEDGH